MNFSFSRSWPQILHTVHPQFSIWPHWFTRWILRQTIGLFIPFTTGKENYMHWIFIFTKKNNYLNFFSDFKDITASTNSTSGGTGNVPLPNILLGVTNPFFGKALKHWPHIVKLGDHNTLNGLLKSPSKSNNGVAEKQKGMSKLCDLPQKITSNKMADCSNIEKDLIFEVVVFREDGLEAISIGIFLLIQR